MKALSLGTNVSSLGITRILGENVQALSDVHMRLSSGLRINKASDDAAGLAVSMNLNSDTKVFGQALRNINDGSSVIAIAETALQNLQEITIRRTELAEQAANGIYTDKQREAIGKEFDELDKEFTRILESTTFNGMRLFDTNETKSLSLTVGYSQINLELDKIISTVTSGGSEEIGFTRRKNNGSVIEAGGSPAAVLIADVNKDGIADVISTDAGTAEQCPNYSSSIFVSIGKGDGTLQPGIQYDIGGTRPQFLEASDLNGDGNLDLVVGSNQEKEAYVLYGSNSGNFSAPTELDLTSKVTNLNSLTALATGDITGDGKSDIITTGRVGSAYKVIVSKNDGSGTFSTATSINAGSSSPFAIETSDLVTGGGQEVIVGDRNTGNIKIYSSDASGNLSQVGSASTGGAKIYSIASGDLDGDGNNDIVAAANDSVFIFKGDGAGGFTSLGSYSTGNTNATAVALGDIDGNGSLDIVTTSNADNKLTVFKGNGDGTFGIAENYKTGGSKPTAINGLDLGDLDNDGKADAVYSNSASGTISVSIAQKNHLNIETIEDSLFALDGLKISLDSITDALGEIGAFQSRLNSAYQVTSVARENYNSANSAIIDADIAEEAANMIRLNILVQSGTAILAQSNTQPQLVMNLLNNSYRNR